MTGDTTPTTPAAVEWTAAERDAVALAAEDALLRMHGVVSSCDGRAEADLILDELAPFVAERERQAAEGAAEAERDRLRAEVRKCQRLVADGLTASASALLGYLARADRIEREVQP